MPTEAPQNNGRDVPGMIMAVIFILVGSIAIWDTTNMADSDSYVFPRAIAIAMILFSIALIVWNLVKPSPADSDTAVPGSTPRRIGLVAIMLISTGLMPYIGFIPAGLIAFAVTMVFAMYDPWTRFRQIVYPLVGIAIVLGFYAVFAKVLLVPLPGGILFD